MLSILIPDFLSDAGFRGLRCCGQACSSSLPLLKVLMLPQARKGAHRPTRKRCPMAICPTFAEKVKASCQKKDLLDAKIEILCNLKTL
jgi:hypothetical protein